MTLELSTAIEAEIKTVDNFRNVIITTNEENAHASTIIKGLRNLKKSVQDTFRPHIKQANELWKGLLADEKKYLEPIEKSEEIIESKMKQFIFAERQRQIESQRKANELAEKEAQKERDRLTKQSELLRAKGKIEEANAKLQEIQMVTATSPIIQNRAEKQEGVSDVAKWTFSITNPELIPREFLSPDEKKIRAYVNAMKKDARIPGVKIEEDISLRVKA